MPCRRRQRPESSAPLAGLQPSIIAPVLPVHRGEQELQEDA